MLITGGNTNSTISTPISLPTTSITHKQHYRIRLPLLQGLDRCLNMKELKQYHTHLIYLGLSDDNDTVGRAIKFCALNPSGDINYGFSLFYYLSRPDPFIYNTLIRASDSLKLYCLMLHRGLSPNQFTFPALLKSVTAVNEARMLHAHILKFGFSDDPYAQNNLIHFYSSHDHLLEARKVFDTMPETTTDVVSWTTLFAGYAKQGLLVEARLLFDRMPVRNSMSWNTMITGYVKAGWYQDAFKLFDRMTKDGAKLDKFVAASMLSACAAIGTVRQGSWIHRQVTKSGIEVDSKLATAIIDMYCKCGYIDRAYEVFDELRDKGLSSWNSMIGGFAIHGQADMSIQLFETLAKMKSPRPDGVTLLNVLTACAHGGLVKEGRNYFESMVGEFGVEPGCEHYGCLVDLLGRAGLISDAKTVVEEMPFEPDAGVLGALLGACRIHKEIQLGIRIGKRLIELDPGNSGRYILLANLYSSAEQWVEASDTRNLMIERRVEREPGISTIETQDGVVSQFIAGDWIHSRSKEIYAKVDEMLAKAKLEGYVIDTGEVLHDVEEEEKESQLVYHSEKLAIALGLLSTQVGQTIRISKNLRVCRDCHQLSKFVSRVFQREIILRDRNRFHRFKDGFCSCNDFW